MISTPVLAIALPFLGGIGAPELIIILVIVLVLFGPKRLPQLGKSLGKTMKAIREGVDGKGGDDEDEENAAAPKTSEEKSKDAPKSEENKAKPTDEA